MCIFLFWGSFSPKGPVDSEAALGAWKVSLDAAYLFFEDVVLFCRSGRSEVDRTGRGLHATLNIIEQLGSDLTASATTPPDLTNSPRHLIM